MIASAWLLAFLGFPVAAGVLFVWWTARYMLRLKLQQKRWDDRRRRLERVRASRADDWDAVMLRRAMLREHLYELRDEILAGSEEAPLKLVEV